MSRRAERQVSSEDITPQQPSDIILPLNGDVDRAPEIIQPLETSAKDPYFDELAFNEEPVTIELLQSQDENAAPNIPFWNNGRGAEVMDERGGWIPITYLPVGPRITIKRKILEQIARAKPDSVRTNIIEMPGQDPINKINRRTFSKYPFNLIEDKNPKGRDWLSRILSER